VRPRKNSFTNRWHPVLRRITVIEMLSDVGVDMDILEEACIMDLTPAIAKLVSLFKI